MSSSTNLVSAMKDKIPSKILNKDKIRSDTEELKARLALAIQTTRNLACGLDGERSLKMIALGKTRRLNNKTFNKLRDEILPIQNKAIEQNEFLKKLESFETQFLQDFNYFVERLAEVSANPDNEAIKERYKKSYESIVTTLTQFNAFSMKKDLKEDKEKIDVVIYWSKINQRPAEIIAQEKNGISLESSFAGYLFNGLDWGADYSIDPRNPLKQFWATMSDEIAKLALNIKPEVHVFEGIVTSSAFYTDEWPKIESYIKEGKVDALYLYIYKTEDESERNIYLLPTLPNSNLNQYENSYIFTKEAPYALYYVKNGVAQELNIDNKREYLKIIRKMKSSDEPIKKELLNEDNPDKKSENPEFKALRRIISRNKNHPGWLSISLTGEPVRITTKEELDRYIITDESYTERQQAWQNKQRTRINLNSFVTRVGEVHRKGWLHLIQALANPLKKLTFSGTKSENIERSDHSKEVEKLDKETKLIPLNVADNQASKKPTGVFNKAFFKRHKTKIILGAVSLGLIVGGLFTFGILSVVGVLGGAGIIAAGAAGLGTAATTIGASVATHVGIAGVAVGVKAAIGTGVAILGASAVGGTTATISSALADMNDNQAVKNDQPKLNVIDKFKAENDEPSKIFKSASTTSITEAISDNNKEPMKFVKK